MAPVFLMANQPISCTSWMSGHDYCSCAVQSLILLKAHIGSNFPVGILACIYSAFSFPSLLHSKYWWLFSILISNLAIHLIYWAILYILEVGKWILCGYSLPNTPKIDCFHHGSWVMGLIVWSLWLSHENTFFKIIKFLHVSFTKELIENKDIWQIQFKLTKNIFWVLVLLLAKFHKMYQYSMSKMGDYLEPNAPTF